MNRPGEKGAIRLAKRKELSTNTVFKKRDFYSFIVQRRSWNACVCIIGGLMLSGLITLLCTNNQCLNPGRGSSSFSQQSLVSCSTLSTGKVLQNCQLPMLLTCKLIDSARRKGKVEMMQFYFS